MDFKPAQGGEDAIFISELGKEAAAQKDAEVKPQEEKETETSESEQPEENSDRDQAPDKPTDGSDPDQDTK